MHASPESGLPNSFWKLLFLAAFLALFCLLPVISMGRGRDTLPLHPIPKTKPGRLHKSLDTPCREALRQGSPSARRAAAPGCAVQCSFYFHAEARRVTRSPTFDLPLPRVGVALVSPKEAHRVVILDILWTIYDVNRLALGTK